MTQAARGLVRTRRGRTIDYKQWTLLPGLATSLSADSTISGGSIAFAVPGTILRIRSFVQAQFDASAVSSDEIDLTYGIGLFATDAVSLGPTAMPDPAVEVEFPWLWWGDMHLHQEGTADPGSWGSNVQRIDVDTKAMRKVKPGESLAWVIQASLASGAPTTLLDIGRGRVLFGT